VKLILAFAVIAGLALLAVAAIGTPVLLGSFVG
jgi:hypothetical protein